MEPMRPSPWATPHTTEREEEFGHEDEEEPM